VKSLLAKSVAGFTVLTLAMAVAVAQTGRMLGSIEAVEVTHLMVKPDRGATVKVELTEKTEIQRVAPGARDLSAAQPMGLLELAPGDRVLVRGVNTADGIAAESIIVMRAQDIERKNEDERLQWTSRGVVGLVQSADVAKGEILLSVRSFEGPKNLTVITSPSTSIKRYAPDSIKFADAVASRIEEIRPGDQLRALGNKSEDGARLTAERIVFGTFRSVAGSITAINAAAGEVTINELASGKPLTVRLRPDSQLKRMPQFPGGAGAPPGAPPMSMRPGGLSGGRVPGGGPPGFGPGRAPGGPPDFSAMIERMPPTSLAELKPGETIIVSSTAGAKPNELTAIVLLAGADALIARLSGGGGQRPGGVTPGAPGGMMSGGIESFMGMSGFPIVP
jgi:hypothetical protein